MAPKRIAAPIVARRERVRFHENLVEIIVEPPPKIRSRVYYDSVTIR